MFVFLKNTAFQPFFTKSQYKKINDLLKKTTFEGDSILDVFNKIKIFNFHFIDKI